MKLQSLSYIKDRKAFQNEISTLENGRFISSQSSIFKLDLFLDNDGILKVGGRINKANLDYYLKHSVLLPKEGHIMHAIIRDHHEKVAHAGQGITMNKICNNGCWIINCTSVVKSVISKCVECRKLHRKICQQKMGNLPADRLSKEPLFSYCGVDMFGSFLVKDG